MLGVLFLEEREDGVQDMTATIATDSGTLPLTAASTAATISSSASG